MPKSFISMRGRAGQSGRPARFGPSNRLKVTSACKRATDEGMDSSRDRSTFRIAELVLDERTVVRRSPDVEHERKVAIFDLLEENSFAPVGSPGGSYYDAIKPAAPAQIEAIDRGRRGLHNEGSQLLKSRLDGKVDIDFDTARRLFTLICVLHIKG